MWTERLRPLILERKATFFEATTAIAFADFAARGAEIAVVEVGLGGRLDSTNVDPPAGQRGDQDRARPHEVSGRHAGEDRLREGRHRQAGRAFVIGERGSRPGGGAAPGGAAGGCAGGPVSDGPTSGSLPPEYEWTGPLGLDGPHQRRNAAVAHGILMALPAPYRPDSATRSRAASPRPGSPGRLDRRGKWLFDVAHNPDGVRALGRAVESMRAASAAAWADLDSGRQGVARDAGRAGPGDRPGRAHGGAHGGEPRMGRGLAPPLAGQARPAAGAGGVEPGAGLRGGAGHGRSRVRARCW